jgi:hypothetical protein
VDPKGCGGDRKAPANCFKKSIWNKRKTFHFNCRNNKIIFGIESLEMKNIIFKGNDNLIKIENCYSNVKVIDDGFYNKIFKKKSNNENLKIKIDVKKIKKFLKKKRIINVNIEIQKK